MVGSPNIRSVFKSRGVLAWVAVAVVSLLPLGCGPAGPNLVPVRGKVTYGGGPWPKPGTITFTGGQRPASAEFDAEGNFTVMSFDKQKGLTAGKYKVAIECWDVPPSMDKPGAEKSFVPQKFRNPSTSGLEIVVEPGKPITDLKFEIPKK